MTLKCKIKEVTELKTREDIEQYPKEEIFDPKPSPAVQVDSKSEEHESVENSSEEEFQLQELGTIEEMSQRKLEQKKAREARREGRRGHKSRGRKESIGKTKSDYNFYDKNSIGRKSS